MQGKKVTRKELYEQVWREPMRRLASRYGISDVGLAKICRKHDIPRPPRGYWAKLEFGKAPQQVPLPNPNDNGQIILRDPESYRPSTPDVKDADAKAAAAEVQRDAKIIVAESLRGAHWLVSQANQELQTCQIDDNQLFTLPDKFVLSLEVSKVSLRRALLIMDALLKALENRGYPVDAGPIVQIQDISIHFSISESLETQREQPKDHDLAGRYEFGHSRFNSVRVPSGHLALHIDDAKAYWASGCRKSWRDATKKRLEDRLNDFVAGLIRFAALKREYDQHLAEEARRKQEAKRLREEEAQCREEKRQMIKKEQARVDSLMEEAVHWNSSQNLRRYIEARSENYLDRNGVISPDSEFAHWLVWATQQADRLDPLVQNPPSLLDEPVPEEPEPRAWWERD